MKATYEAPDLPTRRAPHAVWPHRSIDSANSAASPSPRSTAGACRQHGLNCKGSRIGRHCFESFRLGLSIVLPVHPCIGLPELSA